MRRAGREEEEEEEEEVEEEVEEKQCRALDQRPSARWAVGSGWCGWVGGWVGW